ncbi:MAG TPA: S9 family peptidase [Thermoanaerobaculia bacterium]|nr:S9 family peptidase [Thermoanaerobaculia bacterium]
MNKFVLFLLLLTAPLHAQKKPLTFDALYDPETRVLFGGAIQDDFEWIDDRSFVWPRTDAKGDFVEWRVYDVTAGKERPLFDRAKLQQALVAAGVAAERAKEGSESDELAFDGKKTAAIVNVADDLYLYAIAAGTVTRLTNTTAEEEEATFSPDGTKVAFVRGNDLYVVDRNARERRLTTDGNAQILNGKLDWIYQEEVYGRGIWKGYWWSPDSSRIAFLQLDERQVKEFTVVDHIPYQLDVNVYDYPKPGDPNPVAKLFVVDAAGGERTEVDTARYQEGGEFLIVNVAWASNALTFQVQNREQTWLELATAPMGGSSRVLIRETTKAWVDPLANPVWLADGSFIWQSERSGYRHAYHYRADGTLVRQVTNGPWEVREVHGVDGQHLLFSGTERTVTGQDVYRIRLDGTKLERLSSQAGVHNATFSPSLKHYVDKWSEILTPDQIRVHSVDGKTTRVVEENRVPALAEYDLPRPEFLQVKARDGFVLEAMMIKPPNFDSAKRYPVYQFTYAGPRAQRVRNYWDTNGTRGLFHQLVATEGAIVWIVDNRSAGSKSAEAAWPVHKDLGEHELRDLEDALAWLKSQPYVDGSRVLINGWSYGGFMVLHALTHSKSWSAGIAGGPVTDWRSYDSIYTERLLLKPQSNPEGYVKSSPRFHAKNLHGNLLMIHGTTDDNVHVQNTIQFAQELQKLNRPFEMMLLPQTKHTVTNRVTLRFMQGTVLDFVRRQLFPAD